MSNDEEVMAAKSLTEGPLDLIRQILDKHHRAVVEELRDTVKGMVAARDNWRDKYHDLVFAVATKHPDETRHETAKRYILQAEQPRDNQCASARPLPKGGSEQ